jgi:hypothetical protein
MLGRSRSGVGWGTNTILRRRILKGAAATLVWLIAAALLVTFGGALASTPGTAAAAQYKPPPPPTILLSGLSQPNELAADSRGNLWFTQGGPPSTTATLHVLPKGASAPASVYTTPPGSGVTTSFIIDIDFDAADYPHFVQWAPAGTSVETSLVRVDPTTGAPTALATRTGVVDNNFQLTSGSAFFEIELGADGTIYWTEQTVAGSGEREARLYALAPGAAAPAVIATFSTAGLNHSIGNFDVASDGTVYLQASANVPPPAPAGGTIGIYRLAPGGAPEPIRVFSLATQGPRPVYAALDGKGNLIVGERIFNGFVRVGCSESTTLRLIRFDAAALSGPAPAGTVYSTGTYPEHGLLFVGSSAYLRVSGDGDVLVGLFSGNSRCSNLNAPLTVSHLRMIAVLGSDEGGTQHTLVDDAASPPAVPFAYSFAFSQNDAFATSARLGTLSRIDLNKSAKKPK